MDFRPRLSRRDLDEVLGQVRGDPRSPLYQLDPWHLAGALTDALAAAGGGGGAAVARIEQHVAGLGQGLFLFASFVFHKSMPGLVSNPRIGFGNQASARA